MVRRDSCASVSANSHPTPRVEFLAELTIVAFGDSTMSSIARSFAMMQKRKLLVRTTLAAAAGLVLLAAWQAQPVAAVSQSPRSSHPQHHGPIPAPVAPKRVTPPGPLPHKAGRVAVQRSTAVAPRAKAAITTTSAIPTNPVTLRALVVGLDSADWGVATWKATLDRVGAAYDVLYTKTTALTSANLVGADGAGNYNAILLTSSSLLYDSGGGTFVSGL